MQKRAPNRREGHGLKFVAQIEHLLQRGAPVTITGRFGAW